MPKTMVRLEKTLPPETPAACRNLLLAALPAAEYQRLRPHLKPILLRPGQVLHEEGNTISRVYFLAEGIASFTLTCEQGIEIELSIVGNEGMVGLRALMGGGPTTIRAVVEIGGSSWWMPADVLLEDFRRGGKLQDLLMRQIQARLTETAQTALCNHLHTLEERLSRWLLIIYDRSHSTELDLTQEFIARMLATRRPAVTATAHILKKAGLIDYHRGHITIRDPEGLQDCACGCYKVIHQAVEASLVTSA